MAPVTVHPASSRFPGTGQTFMHRSHDACPVPDRPGAKKCPDHTPVTDHGHTISPQKSLQVHYREQVIVICMIPG